MTNFDAATWEYKQASCDVWQIADLCNQQAKYGWEVVAVLEDHPDAVPPILAGGMWRTGVDQPIKPHVVLFRRPKESTL